MLKCKYCGTELKDGTNFCSTCGAKTEKIPVVDGVGKDTPPDNKAQGYAKSGKPSKRPLHPGVLAWSIVNITTGIASCCFFVPFVSLVLGIIALVYTLIATDCPSEESEKSRIRIAKILNLIATCITVVSVILYIAVIIFGFIANGGFDGTMPYYYYFD